MKNTSHQELFIPTSFLPRFAERAVSGNLLSHSRKVRFVFAGSYFESGKCFKIGSSDSENVIEPQYTKIRFV
ncbi:hypothetical protein CH375_05735 [Leptospira ellisii]|uniref:Uncharacterized protein n=1 Tax=Leptospira ellisii TaxID=2023197 RepID=A0A2N0BMY1_9LEPT|nr:hypothetical protein CH379_01880 [Leptospira ellisii]PKA05333.1 hypothetical protein CH375_05735 [Leptospira ellisii]